MSCSSWIVLEMGGKCLFISWCVASRIFSVKLIAFLCSSLQTFSLCVSSAFMWCIRTVVLIQLVLGRNPILFSRIDQNMIDSQLIAVYAFARCILTSLSVDETLLPMYMNLSTNFKISPFRVEMAPSWLKCMNSVLFAFTLRSMSPAACPRLQQGLQQAREGLFSRRAISSP